MVFLITIKALNSAATVLAVRPARHQLQNLRSIQLGQHHLFSSSRARVLFSLHTSSRLFRLSKNSSGFRIDRQQDPVLVINPLQLRLSVYLQLDVVRNLV